MQETAKKTNAGSSEEKENQTKKDAFKRRDGVFRVEFVSNYHCTWKV